MMRRLLLLICFLLTFPLVGTSTVVAAPVGPSGEWDLAFSDEFDGTYLDGSRWVPCRWNNWQQDWCTGFPAAGEQQVYLKKNVTVANGLLTLTARKEDYTANGTLYHYTSGIITTASKWYFQPPFYVEGRIRFARGAGAWNVWWATRKYEDGLPYQEMDFIELLGFEPNRVHLNFHGVSEPPGTVLTNAAPWTDDYHIYGGLLEPGRATWFIDGAPVKQVTDPAITTFNMYLLLNVALGGWGGTIDDAMFPTTLTADWVRLWKPKRTPTPTATPTETATPTPTYTLVPPSITPSPTIIPTDTPTPTPACQWVIVYEDADTRVEKCR